MKSIILVPYVASSESIEIPTAEAKFLFEEYFRDSSYKQVLGKGLEGRLYINGDVGLYIIGEGKTNASMYATALLSNNEFDFSDTKFILFGCCGCARDVGVVGDIYLVAETVDYELGHHADAREIEGDANHTWYPNQSFSRYGHVDLRNDFYDSVWELIKDEKAISTQDAKEYMSKTFGNNDWAIRNPKIMKVTSVTADSYWKGNHDHQNAKYIVDYYKCKHPFAATDMEDIAIAQVFCNYNITDKLLILRFAVNTDVFMIDQSPETIWSDGGSFDYTGFDNFNESFETITKRATEICKKIAKLN